MYFIDLKKPLFFCNTLHYKSKDTSLAIIYFDIGDLHSCFQSVFRMADNVAAGIVWDQMHSDSVKAAAGQF